MPEDTPDADPTRAFRATLRGIGSVVAPTTAVTALLYYFGWTRTNVEATELGLDDSLFGYSTQDYLLRSLTSMFAPLVVGLFAVLVGLAANGLVMARAQAPATTEDQRGGGSDGVDRRFIGRVAKATATAAVVLLVLGVAGTLVPDPSTWRYVASPAAVTVAIVLLVYAANLTRRFLLGPTKPEAVRALERYEGIVTGTVLMLVVVSLFWNVSHYAVVKGIEFAETVEERVSGRPEVIIYSHNQLYLQPPVVETAIGQPDAAYRYAYSGLKLLFRSDGRYFLRPSDPASRANIVIPDALDIRLEFYES